MKYDPLDMLNMGMVTSEETPPVDPSVTVVEAFLQETFKHDSATCLLVTGALGTYPSNTLPAGCIGATRGSRRDRMTAHFLRAVADALDPPADGGAL